MGVSDPNLDLLHQNLMLHKLPRWILCTFKCEKQGPGGQPAADFKYLEGQYLKKRTYLFCFALKGRFRFN